MSSPGVAAGQRAIAARAGCLACAAALLWLWEPLSPDVACGTPTPGATLAPTPRTTGTAGDGARIRSQRRRVSRAWWHEPALVTALKLSEEQRGRMDEILTRRMDARRRLLADHRRADSAFEKALIAGDWPAARRQVEEMRKSAAGEAESRAQLRLDVFAVLSPDQRRELVEQHPLVLTQPWLPGYGRRRPMAPRNPPPQATPVENR